MTKTYNDVEAVTRLLEEKEKDVELTARIGKELLNNNQRLENLVTNLESELKTAREKITQLSHELNKKNELIQILTNDFEDLGAESGAEMGAISLDILQQKIGKLEQENSSLRSEASQLAADTDEAEQQEHRLVSDFGLQLRSLNQELSSLTEETNRYREENITYKQLSQNLTEKLTHSEGRLSKVCSENEKLMTLLTIARETQNELAIELSEFKEKYGEVLALLEETQQMLKKQKKKSVPCVAGGGGDGYVFSGLHHRSPCYSGDPSLGTELESSIFSELSWDSGIGTERTSPHYKKIFDTVRSASRHSFGDGSSSSDSSWSGAGDIVKSSSLMVAADHSTTSSVCHGSALYGNKKYDSRWRTISSSQRSSWHLSDDQASSATDSDEDSAYLSSRYEGIPGAPGSKELAEAVKKLTPAAVYARRMALSSGLCSPFPYPESECRTPDSIMSTRSVIGGYCSIPPYKLPDKLQIVKPIEGSLTLQHWNQLATPSMDCLLNETPGVRTKGEVNLEDLGLRVYSLEDVEEDELIIHPGKSFQPCGTVYTFTNSTVMHPDDGTTLTTSVQGSRMCTASNSRASTAPQTPLLSRRNSTCTFSVTLGLAKLLNERGITAATPSTLVTPDYTPTATPRNSPEGGRSLASSPDHSRSPSPSNNTPYLNSSFALPGYLVSSGVEYLRKTLTGGILDQPATSKRSRLKKHSQNLPSTSEECSSLTTTNKFQESTGIGLVQSVEKLGVQTLIAAGPSSGSSAVVDTPKVITPLAEGSNRNATTTIAEELDFEVDKRLVNELLPNARLRQLNRNAKVRPDLGTVLGSVPSLQTVATTAASSDPSSSFVCSETQKSSYTGSSALGTLSSMLFGRKGGLL